MIGLINATKYSEHEKGLTTLIRIAGTTLLERHIRIMRKVGIKQIYVAALNQRPEIEAVVNQIPFNDITINVVNTEQAQSTYIFTNNESETPLMFFDGASLFDERLPERFLDVKEDQIASLPESALLPDERNKSVIVESAGTAYSFMGIAALKASWFNEIDFVEGDDWLKALLNKVAESPEAILDASKLTTYDYDMRRDQSYMHMPIESSMDNSKAKWKLLDRSQKSVLDWPAWFIHRPIEKGITYYLCEYPITPNQITIINVIVAFIATALFAKGYLITGLVLALASGIMDGLDGKQARVKIMMSKIGKLEEVSDRIYEYSWYLALAYWLVQTGHPTIPYVLFSIMFILHAMDVAIGGIFKYKRGVQLDDYGPLERNFRWIGARRNTNMWTLIPFIAFGMLYAGYWFLVVYYTITVGFRLWRLVHHLSHDTQRQLS